MGSLQAENKRIYLDNAATTFLSEEVINILHKINLEFIGNPSSIHSFGRLARAKIERARKNIAKHINANPSEIIFTSGGTEANNTAILMSIKNLGVSRIITSKIEHYAILKPIRSLAPQIKIDYVNIDDEGNIDLNHLTTLLKSNEKTFVSLMHVNNEIGTKAPIKTISKLCQLNNAYFHSDAVQSIPYYDIDVKKVNLDFLSCSAHKFHGPKGCGFLFVKQSINVTPFIEGGSQERGLRGGTENISGICGLNEALLNAKALQIENFNHLSELKKYLLHKLDTKRLLYKINGNRENSSPAIINISFSTKKDVSMLLFNLDLSGIAISGGSACSSGSNQGSHVLKEIGAAMNIPAIRVSFSKYTVKADIDCLVESLVKLLSYD
jgi:cysteine desulfurase